ncbi:MAG: GrpB family protein [Clostridiaceae bacterium]|nr:GrpB family protein [Clostridiaceae bacterium]
MGKPLSELTLEELWELFPIQLTKHQSCWEDWYREEESFLCSVLPGEVKLHHIGSTSIRGIWAKPIIDILVEADSIRHDSIMATLLRSGYICMAHDGVRTDFNKGYTPDGFAQKVFHLHLRALGDNDELYFRDYLNEQPEVAKAYEQLKLSLLKRFEHDRDGYTGGKTAFVSEYTQKAIEQYGRIYLK